MNVATNRSEFHDEFRRRINSGKYLRRRPRQEDNIKTGLREIGFENER
jgi:hypothetical protein